MLRLLAARRALLEPLSPRARRLASAAAAPASKGRKNKAAQDADDMEPGFARELKRSKAALAPLYQPAKTTPDAVPPEELEALKVLAAQYANEKAKAVSARKRAVQMQILLKKEALRHLPEEFADCRFHFAKLTAPLARVPATETPPIEDFSLFGAAPDKE